VAEPLTAGTVSDDTPAGQHGRVSDSPSWDSFPPTYARMLRVFGGECRTVTPGRIFTEENAARCVLRRR